MASEYSIDSAHAAGEHSVFLHRFDKVLGARWVEFAPGTEQRADSALVKPNDFDHHP
jgi:hypothetical protein